MPKILYFEQDRKLALPSSSWLTWKGGRWHGVQAQLSRTNLARIEESMARVWAGDGCVG